MATLEEAGLAQTLIRLGYQLKDGMRETAEARNADLVAQQRTLADAIAISQDDIAHYETKLTAINDMKVDSTTADNGLKGHGMDWASYISETDAMGAAIANYKTALDTVKDDAGFTSATITFLAELGEYKKL